MNQVETTFSGFVNPYPGIKSFQDTPQDREYFCGRDEERKALLHLVQSSPQVVLFSRSGLGKTSLIQAGLMQTLREQGCIPVVARVTADLDAGPVLSVVRTFEEQCAKAGVRIVHQPRIIPGSAQTRLWDFFCDVAFDKGDAPLKPILIIDQCEELFTRCRAADAEAFNEQLADILRRRVPESLRREAEAQLAEYDKEPESEEEKEKRRQLSRFAFGEAAADVKVLLAIREDYLPELYALVPRIPTIMRHTLRLEPFTREHAREAIETPSRKVRDIPGSAFTFEKGVVEEIVDFLRRQVVRGRAEQGDRIDPFQLQILCRRLNENRHQAGRKTISSADLGGKGGMEKLTRQYYSDICRQVPRVRVGWSPQRFWPSISNLWFINFPRLAVRRLCEGGLVQFGHRNSLSAGAIASKYGVGAKDLEHLVKGRLVRGEERFGTLFYEITHDSLLEPLAQARDVRRKQTTVAAVIAAFCLIPSLAGLLGAYSAWRLEQRAVALEAVIDQRIDLPRFGPVEVRKLNDAIEDYNALEIPANRKARHLSIPARSIGDVIMNPEENIVRRQRAVDLAGQIDFDLNLPNTKSVGRAESKLIIRELNPRGRLVLERSDLSNVSFSKARFDRCTPVQSPRFGDEPVDLKRPVCAVFASARMTNVDFSDSSMAGAVFTDATISGIIFSGVTGSSFDFARANISQILFSRGAVLGLDMRRTTVERAFFGDMQLGRANFAGARLGLVMFADTDLNYADFSGAMLTEVSFTNSELEGAKFQGAQLANVSFAGSPWWLAAGWTEEQILAFKTRYPPAHYARGTNYKQGIDARMRDAKGERFAAERPERERASSLNTLSWYRAIRGQDLNEAEREINAALKISPDNPHFLDTKAFILMQRRRFQEAADALNAALMYAMSPIAKRESQYRYAMCLEHLGRHKEAEPFYRSAADLGYEPTYELVLVERPRPRRPGV